LVSLNRVAEARSKQKDEVVNVGGVNLSKLKIWGLITIFLGASIAIGLLVQSSAEPTQGEGLASNESISQEGECGIPDTVGIDWSTASDFQRLVDRSDLIVKGVVVSSDAIEIDRPDCPERLQTTQRGFKEIRILHSFKGNSSSNVIAVGQEALERLEPQLMPGMTVYLFLGQVDHDRLRHPVSYDYVIQGGPQGQFRVNDGGFIEPQGMSYLSTTVQFCRGPEA
jgi:hypothetical protein